MSERSTVIDKSEGWGIIFPVKLLFFSGQKAELKLIMRLISWRNSSEKDNISSLVL